MAAEERGAIRALVGMKESEIEDLEDDDCPYAGGLGMHPGDAGTAAADPEAREDPADPGDPADPDVGPGKPGGDETNDISLMTRADLESLARRLGLKLRHQELELAHKERALRVLDQMYEKELSMQGHRLTASLCELTKEMQLREHFQALWVDARDRWRSAYDVGENLRVAYEASAKRIDSLEHQANLGKRVYGQVSRENGECERSYAMRVVMGKH